MYKKSWEECGVQVFSREYSLWNGINQRLKNRPNSKWYGNCRMSDNFKDFQFFAAWCNRQVGFLNRNGNGTFWHIDKDMLCPGNITYGEDVCVFIPLEINLFLGGSDADRKLPRGVDMFKGRYRARCKDGSKSVFLGYYETAKAAAEAYGEYKRKLAASKAIEFKGIIDNRVIAALEAYADDRKE